MDDVVKLFDELEWLKREAGLTALRLGACPTLLKHLRKAGEGPEDAKDRLEPLVRLIENSRQQDALLRAHGIIGRATKLSERRRELARTWGRSEETVRRYEQAGHRDLVRIILEHSVHRNSRDQNEAPPSPELTLTSTGALSLGLFSRTERARLEKYAELLAATSLLLALVLDSLPLAYIASQLLFA